ncbi:MAG: thioesterase family protein [Chitinophagales bacterium]
MERVTINLPEKFLYKQQFKIRQEDINEVNHMGNERVLVFVNAIKEGFFSELNLVPNSPTEGIIFANHSINYKSEGFLGDEITCNVGVANITECSFDLISHFVKNNSTTLAIVRTGIVYYDYEKRKIKALPESFITAFTK